jgi:cephalosporin-C deacetylase-like acetyl esterase
MNVHEVEFPSERTVVRGDLYLPEGDGPHPTVVMAGGWCYVKELRQPNYAESFVNAGMAALIFDYRNLGASDGEIRQHLDPWAQIADYRNAITFVESRSELDSDRIGVWGISYSGGHALILAAIDERVRAAVANVPVIDGYQNMWRVHGTERFRLLREHIAEDRRKRFATGEYGYMPMSGSPNTINELATWPFDEVRVVFDDLQRTQAPRHEHRNTIASVDLLMQYNALSFVSRIRDTPTMMITAEGDDITLEDLELAAFNGITTPDKSLLVLPGTSHMTLYSNVSRLQIAAQAATKWYLRHLVNPVTPESLLADG